MEKTLITGLKKTIQYAGAIASFVRGRIWYFAFTRGVDASSGILDAIDGDNLPVIRVAFWDLDKKTRESAVWIGGYSFLHRAAMRGRDEILKFFLDKGYNPNVFDKEMKLNPLMLAVQGNHIKAAHVLIDAKTDLNHQNAVGGTALMMAVQRDNAETAGDLLAAGARTDLRDNRGLTVWQMGMSPRMRAVFEPYMTAHAYDVEPARPQQSVLLENDKPIEAVLMTSRTMPTLSQTKSRER